MTPATKEPEPEVYCPQDLRERLVHYADAIRALNTLINRDDHLLKIMEANPATRETRALWGATTTLKDVSSALSGMAEKPSEYADELDGLVGPIWKASYRMTTVTVVLEEVDGGPAESFARALADGLNDLGSVTDERRARAARRRET